MDQCHVGRTVVPTPWGYATLHTYAHAALPDGTAVRRTDTVLPPTVTPAELAALHAVLRAQPTGAPSFTTRMRLPAAVRRALRRAIDVQTTAVTEIDVEAVPAARVLRGFQRAMRAVESVALPDRSAALARQLAWSGFLAARAGDTAGVREAAASLHHLALVSVAPGSAYGADA